MVGFTFVIKDPAIEENEDKKSDDSKKTCSLNSKTTSSERPCPVPSCGSHVIYLSQHLQEVHGWSEEQSRTIATCFGMRKKYSFTNRGNAPKKKKKTTDKTDHASGTLAKDYHHYRYCPVSGCTSLVKRIPSHLKNVHKLQPGSEENSHVLARLQGPVKESFVMPYHQRPRAAGVKDSSPSIQEVDQGDDDASSVQSSDTVVPTFVLQFETWLKSAGRGNLDENTSKQHPAQISKLLNLIDSKHELASLFNEKAVSEKVLEGSSKREYHPKTTKSYLMSLRHF